MEGQLKVTLTITNDLYPEITTVDIQATDGTKLHYYTKHYPKSFFQSEYAFAAKACLEAVGDAFKEKENA